MLPETGQDKRMICFIMVCWWFVLFIYSAKLSYYIVYYNFKIQNKVKNFQNFI